MPIMPDVAAKTSYFRLFDEHINQFDKNTLQAAVRDIESGATIRERVKKVRGLSKPGLNHIMEHWLGDARAWWPEYPINDLLTEGFYQAYQTMLYPLDSRRSGKPRSKILPLETIWLCACFHTNIVISESPRQVTMLLMTPPSPDRFEPYQRYRRHFAEKKDERDGFERLGYQPPKDWLRSAKKYKVPEPFLLTAMDHDHGVQPFVDFTRPGAPKGISTRRPFVRTDEMRDPDGDVFEPLVCD